MAIELPKRTKQIAAKITPATPGQEAILYQSSNATVLGTNVNYQGGMAVIRALAYIDSLPETYAPVILPTDTLQQKEQKNQLFRISPKKGLLVSLQSPAPANQDFEVGMIDLYNVKPVFQTGVNEFFSGLTIYGIQSGWKIHAKIVDRGHGLLLPNPTPLQNDWVSITGYVDENSSILQDHNNIVYNFI
jgi:hypothetical protein